MHTPKVRTYPKDAHYRIQDPITGLYARIESDPPPSPQPAESATDSVSWSSSHVTFREKPLASWWETYGDALRGFAKYIGVARLEIVRCER